MTTGGRPPRHGARFKCSQPSTWPKPDARLVADDHRYGTVTVTAWHGMHPKLEPSPLSAGPKRLSGFPNGYASDVGRLAMRRATPVAQS
jgi:hypothetical protein